MKNIILFFLIICCSSLYAQKMEANYQLANKYTISKLIEKYNPRKVSPYWINKNSDFIYCVKQGDNIDVFNVNPKKTEKQKLTLQIDKIDDNKYMIEQLARRHSFIDIDRVGIWGGSSGGFMAATAMLKYPEFYKVGVSRAGQHDPNIFHGWQTDIFNSDVNLGVNDTIYTNISLVKNLKGKLFIIHGEIDVNVHASNSARLVNELMKAGKYFDYLVVPGGDHGWSEN